MDARFLADRGFWLDDRPWAFGFAGPLPGMDVLRGQVLFQTSGSSGRPKWLALSKEALQHSARAVNAHLEVDARSCWGLALPVHHVGGFGVAARAMAADCRMAVFAGRWDPAAFAAWLADERVTHTSLVPTQVHDLVRDGLRAPSSLRAVVVGGGRLDEPSGRAARELGWPVLASYGLTEAGSQVATQSLDTLNADYTPAPLPVLPIWNVRVDEDDCLLIAGPALFSGILVPDAAGWRYEPRTGDGFRTADRVLCESGWLTPLGRADLRVKVLGELVDPEAAERELAESFARCGGSSEVLGAFAVAAVPDARTGHRLAVFCETRIPRPALDAALADYQARVPGHLRLAGPYWREALPRSPLGKLLRRQLAE